MPKTTLAPTSPGSADNSSNAIPLEELTEKPPGKHTECAHIFDIGDEDQRQSWQQTASRWQKAAAKVSSLRSAVANCLSGPTQPADDEKTMRDLCERLALLDVNPTDTKDEQNTYKEKKLTGLRQASRGSEGDLNASPETAIQQLAQNALQSLGTSTPPAQYQTQTPKTVDEKEYNELNQAHEKATEYFNNNPAECQSFMVSSPGNDHDTVKITPDDDDATKLHKATLMLEDIMRAIQHYEKQIEAARKDKNTHVLNDLLAKDSAKYKELIKSLTKLRYGDPPPQKIRSILEQIDKLEINSNLTDENSTSAQKIWRQKFEEKIRPALKKLKELMPKLTQGQMKELVKELNAENSEATFKIKYNADGSFKNISVTVKDGTETWAGTDEIYKKVADSINDKVEEIQNKLPLMQDTISTKREALKKLETKTRLSQKRTQALEVEIDNATETQIGNSMLGSPSQKILAYRAEQQYNKIKPALNHLQQTKEVTEETLNSYEPLIDLIHEELCTDTNKMGLASPPEKKHLKDAYDAHKQNPTAKSMATVLAIAEHINARNINIYKKNKGQGPITLERKEVTEDENFNPNQKEREDMLQMAEKLKGELDQNNDGTEIEALKKVIQDIDELSNGEPVTPELCNELQQACDNAVEKIKKQSNGSDKLSGTLKDAKLHLDHLHLKNLQADQNVLETQLSTDRKELQENIKDNGVMYTTEQALRAGRAQVELANADNIESTMFYTERDGINPEPPPQNASAEIQEAYEKVTDAREKVRETDIRLKNPTTDLSREYMKHKTAEQVGKNNLETYEAIIESAQAEADYYSQLAELAEENDNHVPTYYNKIQNLLITLDNSKITSLTNDDSKTKLKNAKTKLQASLTTLEKKCDVGKFPASDAYSRIEQEVRQLQQLQDMHEDELTGRIQEAENAVEEAKEAADKAKRTVNDGAAWSFARTAGRHVSRILPIPWVRSKPRKIIDKRRKKAKLGKNDAYNTLLEAESNLERRKAGLKLIKEQLKQTKARYPDYARLLQAEANRIIADKMQGNAAHDLKKPNANAEGKKTIAPENHQDDRMIKALTEVEAIGNASDSDENKCAKLCAIINDLKGKIRENGDSELMHAIRQEKTEVTKSLIDAGAHLDYTNNKTDENALMLAAKTQQHEVISELVNSGADLTARDNTGRSALDHYLIGNAPKENIAKALSPADNNKYFNPNERRKDAITAHLKKVPVSEEYLKRRKQENDAKVRRETIDRLLSSSETSETSETVDENIITNSAKNGDPEATAQAIAADNNPQKLITSVLEKTIQGIKDATTQLEGEDDLLKQLRTLANVASPQQCKALLEKTIEDVKVIKKNPNRDNLLLQLTTLANVASPQQCKDLLVTINGSDEQTSTIKNILQSRCDAHLSAEEYTCCEIKKGRSHQPVAYQDNNNNLKIYDKDFTKQTNMYQHDENQQETAAAADVASLEELLLSAAALGNHALVKAIIAKGISPNTLTDEGMTPIMVAAHCGHANVVNALLKEGADINATDGKGQTVLHHAAAGGNANVVNTLLKKGADINAKDDKGQTVLHHAAAGGDAATMDLLLSNDTIQNTINAETKNTKTDEKKTALIVAIEHGNMKAVPALLRNGAVINTSYPYNEKQRASLISAINETADSYAGPGIIVHGHRQGYMSTKRNELIKQPRTTLHAAAQQSDIPRIQEFINSGVNVSTKSAGQTPLHCAIEKQHTDAAKLLIKHTHANDINSKNLDERTALHLAAKNGHKEIVKALLNKHNINSNAEDNNGQTPLHLAAANGYTEIVKKLLEKGADYNLQDNIGKRTALHFAAEAGYTEIVANLLVHVEDVNLPDKEKRTALHLAAANGHEEIVEELLVKDAKLINREDTDKRTALQLAAANGHTAIVKALLDKDEGVKITDEGVKITDEDVNNALQLLLDTRNHLSTSQERNKYSTIVRLLSSKIGAEDRENEITTLAKAGDTAMVRAMAAGSEDPEELINDMLTKACEKDDNEFDVTETRTLANVASPQQCYKLYNDNTAGLNDKAKAILLSRCDKYNEDRHIPIYKDQDEFKTLIEAINAGNVKEVETAINSGVRLNQVGPKNKTLLQIALKKKPHNREIIRLLIQSGANTAEELYTCLQNNNEAQLTTIVSFDVNNAGRNGETALHLAAKDGKKKIVSKLITELGSDVDLKNDNKQTALHLAAAKGHTDIVNALLKQGADATLTDKNGQTPLQLAAKNGKTEAVKALLDAGTGFDTEDTKGQTAIMLAAESSHAESVIALFNHGASTEGLATPLQNLLNGKGKKGLSPTQKTELQEILSSAHLGQTKLHNAANQGRKDQAIDLINKGADVNAQNNYDETALHHAAYSGHDDIVKALLEARADVNVQDKQEQTPLHHAAAKGHTDIVNALLHQGADAALIDKNGKTPLHLAAENGGEEIVEALLEKGANVDLKNDKEQTALHLAAAKGHTDIVNALLKQDADAALTDKNGQTPLHLAAKNGHKEIVEALLAASDDININAEDNNRQTPLQLAAEAGDAESVIALFNHGASTDGISSHLNQLIRSTNDEQITTKLNKINESVRQGQTALHLAAANGNTADVQALLKNKHIKINAEDKNGQTPLHLAAKNGHKEIVEALLKHDDIDHNATDNNGQTPLHLAAAEGHTDIVSAIFKDSNYIDPRDRDHRTPLHLAAENGHTETVVKLLANDNDITQHINHKDTRQITALHLAAKNGHKEIVQALLANKHIDIIAEDNNGQTPLHLAAANGKTAAVEALLNNHNININAEDNNRQTPLQLAAKNGHKEIVEVLLNKHNIDINAEDKNGQTPLHLAAAAGKTEIVKKLLEQDADATLTDKNGKTPLDLAKKAGHVEIVKAIYTKRLIQAKEKIKVAIKDLNGSKDAENKDATNDKSKLQIKYTNAQAKLKALNKQFAECNFQSDAQADMQAITEIENELRLLEAKIRTLEEERQGITLRPKPSRFKRDANAEKGVERAAAAEAKAEAERTKEQNERENEVQKKRTRFAERADQSVKGRSDTPPPKETNNSTTPAPLGNALGPKG